MTQCWMILLILSSRILVSGCLQLQFYDKLYWLYMKYPEVTRKILSNGQNSSVRVEISKMEIFSDAELFPVIFFLAPCKRLTIIFSINPPPPQKTYFGVIKNYLEIYPNWQIPVSQMTITVSHVWPRNDLRWKKVTATQQIFYSINFNN